MTTTQRVAGYMQEHMTDRQQLAMLNIMERAKRGQPVEISNELTPHAVNICAILMKEPVRGDQPKVAA